MWPSLGLRAASSSWVATLTPGQHYRWAERTLSSRFFSNLSFKNLSYVFDFYEVWSFFCKRIFVIHIQNYGLHPDIWLYCICTPLTALQCNGMLFDTEWHSHFCLISHCSITLLFLHVICIKLCVTVLFYSWFLILSWLVYFHCLEKYQYKSRLILDCRPNTAGSRYLVRKQHCIL